MGTRIANIPLLMTPIDVKLADRRIKNGDYPQPELRAYDYAASGPGRESSLERFRVRPLYSRPTTSSPSTASSGLISIDFGD